MKRLYLLSILVLCGTSVFAGNSSVGANLAASATAGPQFLTWWGTPESFSRGPYYCDDIAPYIQTGSIFCEEDGLVTLNESGWRSTRSTGWVNNCNQPVSITTRGDGGPNIIASSVLMNYWDGFSYGGGGWVDASGDGDASPSLSVPC